MAARVALVTRSMENEYFFNADGEFLIVAQEGRLRFRTEFRVVTARRDLHIIPRGIMFKVELTDGPARAYVCENYGGAFTLPDRGPIGANCLANPRDFLHAPPRPTRTGRSPRRYSSNGAWRALCRRDRPVAARRRRVARQRAPYKYDLRHFSPVGAISFDHPDPSIFTVLAAPSERRAPPASTS